MMKVSAIVICDIDHHNLDGQRVLIKRGEIIQVDLDDNIAIYNDKHFDVIPCEYNILSN